MDKVQFYWTKWSLIAYSSYISHNAAILMERQKRWQWTLILAVLALTLYNIIPTVLYYSKPLGSPINQEQGMRAAEEIAGRLHSLESEGEEWLRSYCALLNIKPVSIALDPKQPRKIVVQCGKAEEAAQLRRSLSRAGSLIPFAPAQLTPLADESHSKTVSVLRRVGVRLDNVSRYFAFTPKFEQTKQGESIAPLYAKLVLDRAAKIASLAAGPSEGAQLLRAIQRYPSGQAPEELLVAFASKINGIADLNTVAPETAARFSSSLAAGSSANELDQLSSMIDALRDRLKLERLSLQQKSEEELASLGGEEAVRLIEKKEKSLSLAQQFLKKQRADFLHRSQPLSFEKALEQLSASSSLPLDASPLFDELLIDWKGGEISLRLRPDLAALEKSASGEIQGLLQQLFINEIARIGRASNETLLPKNGAFTLRLHQLADAESFLVFDLDEAAKDQKENLLTFLRSEWRPKHPDLIGEHFPIVDKAGYDSLTERQKKLCLCVFSPAAGSPLPAESLNRGSLYIFARGLDRILEQAKNSPSTASSLLQSDIGALSNLLRQSGFFGYGAGEISPENAGDYLFEQPDAFGNLLAATREEFQTKGSQRYAFLEFSTLEQRILTQNRIDTRIHDELIKWRDEYSSAQAMPDPALRFDVPKPSRSVFLSNLALSFKKYLRGDERKVIRWGLDLSGGKTVQIELRDQNHKPVTAEADLRQGINELYNRVNKMGVSEVAIRQLGNNIVLDFPGSQALGASELVKASSMYFHIVNEKFSSFNPQLSEASNRFLQEVWNEAVVMNRTDPESVNAIAWKHLHGDNADPSSIRPRSDAARTLYEQGLRLQPPSDPSCSAALDETVSKIAILREEDKALQRQGHPLLLVFSNYALEGSSLANIRASYDPSKGNFLGFDVKGSLIGRSSPQSDLHAWTSRFSQESIVGTPQEIYSRGAGWRMAVILNDTVISAPTLNSALKESAMISGSFTQREVNQLAADLKAGSLTFTPHILSEKNVSPELGKSDRMKGITATIAALLLVIVSMVCYYRFSGIVASVAVLVNLLILWATLQNLQATLSLAGIAGIILTVGMAVDANVLVFERIKEELAAGKRLASAIAAGYQKAFSAILDSNVTTIIAALILLNFDAGPIKGFAVTLIIGIASSMFTALFMTKAYFTYWVNKTTSKTLSMANWIRTSSFNFLRYSKGAILGSLVLIVIGGALLVTNRTSLFGMDFTGGYAVEFEVENIPQPSEAVAAALQKAGASPQDFQIRQLNPASHLRVLFSTAMEQPGKPFHSHTGPQIAWILNALEQQSIHLTSESLASIETSWVAISGQMSDSMRNNALLGLAIAFACIFIYLTVRFESTYAASAILCLLHDVAITLGVIGLLHALKVPVQIDLNTIAALMTIVGYSLNDTIIIFDRIREDVHFMKGKPLTQIVNRALNATLSRTSITSGTTLLVLIALVLLGGSSIFSFALVMTIGVFFGTLSSWFVASPLLLAFQKRESKKVHVVVVD